MQTNEPNLLYSELSDDPDLREIVGLFVAEMPQRISRLEQTWRGRDWEELGRAAHQLKGAAGSYGFDAITPSAAALEMAVRNGEPEERLAELLGALVQLCRAVRAGAPDDAASA